MGRAALEVVAEGGMGTSFNLFSSKSEAHPMLDALKSMMYVTIYERFGVAAGLNLYADR